MISFIKVKKSTKTLQCGWVKAILHRGLSQISSTAMRKTHCHLSQTLDCSYCRWWWHRQLLGAGGNYLFWVRSHSLYIYMHKQAELHSHVSGSISLEFCPLRLKGARFVAGVSPSAGSRHHSVLDLYQITYTVTETTINTNKLHMHKQWHMHRASCHWQITELSGLSSQLLGIELTSVILAF